jgi:hypothetical protein
VSALLGVASDEEASKKRRMKLLNPTDDELNAAFAKEVAGWKWEKTDRDHMAWIEYREGGSWEVEPNFTTSADAVLPYVSKLKEVGIHYVDGDWFVRCWSEDKNCANCDSFAKACVIALLRARGVEVEFKP